VTWEKLFGLKRDTGYSGRQEGDDSRSILFHTKESGGRDDRWSTPETPFLRPSHTSFSERLPNANFMSPESECRSGSICFHSISPGNGRENLSILRKGRGEGINDPGAFKWGECTIPDAHKEKKIPSRKPIFAKLVFISPTSKAALRHHHREENKTTMARHPAWRIPACKSPGLVFSPL